MGDFNEPQTDSRCSSFVRFNIGFGKPVSLCRDGAGRHKLRNGIIIVRVRGLCGIYFKIQ